MSVLELFDVCRTHGAGETAVPALRWLDHCEPTLLRHAAGSLAVAPATPEVARERA
ncbi:hypothetical protein [Dactylosporangium sp. CA-139066]|uniref:hypothetical protein n=1 Tax=Dactylosporangium sp. CA-139066 TaxID=3239930 RepID=UPI003D89C982